MKMVHIKIYFIFLFSFTILSCSSQNKANIQKVDTLQTKNKNVIINDWKKDSIGCLGLRTLDLSKKIILKNNLLGKSKVQFLLYFGAPNKMINNGERVVLIYYIKSFCKDKVIYENTDKCWIQFSFVNDKLQNVPIVYACE